MSIAEVLEERQKQRGISYAELSRRTRINEDMISRFINGKSMPKGDQLIRLCVELGLDVEDFSDERTR